MTGTHRIYVLLLWLIVCEQVQSFTANTRISPHHIPSTTRISASASDDKLFLEQAVAWAKQGLGHTFPNPAVGCVLVNEHNQIIGQGFHPRAGYPHAEVFALWQAAGHVPDGVAAAQAVLQHANTNHPELQHIQQLAQQYRNDPSSLITAFSTTTRVTAYVTLEPCCHYGQTPPCAAALKLAQVQRVVVGFRDPNPRVNGGGVQFLQQHGITVDVVNDAACAALVTAFCQRITRRVDDDTVTGAMRSVLRTVAGRLKAAGTLAEVSWAKDMIIDVEALLQQQDTGDDDQDLDDDKINNVYKTIHIKPEWMEHLDQLLWDHEMVQVRLNNAVNKKKDAKVVGLAIAAQLQAHVAQTVGHTCLLYRPGVPPVLNLKAMLQESSQLLTSSTTREDE